MSTESMKKSLYHAVMKAMDSKTRHKQSANAVVEDIKDDNMLAEVPKDSIPASKKSVLYKDMSLSELHRQKQMQADASMGALKPPTMQKGVHKLKGFMEKCAMKKNS